MICISGIAVSTAFRNIAKGDLKMGTRKTVKLGLVLLLTVALLLTTASVTAFAGTTSKVKVGSVTLEDDQCLVSNSAASATDGDNGGNYVAYFKDNTYSDVYQVLNFTVSG